MPFLDFPEAVLFDWDNTIVDTWPVIHGGMSAVFKKRGLTPWTLDEVKERCHQSGREAFPNLFPDDWQAALDDFYEYVSERHLAGLTLLPYALELIERLVDLDIPVALVSNKTKALIVKEVEHLKFTSHFKAVVGAGDALFDKPSAAPILLALEQLGVAASKDVWMIGDTPVDWLSARAAEVFSIGVGAASITNQADAPEKMYVDLQPLCYALGAHVRKTRIG